MVPGIPPLIWLWHQPTELHCLGKSSQNMAPSSPADKRQPGTSNTSLSPNSTFMLMRADAKPEMTNC